jgi:hypothetical protein
MSTRDYVKVASEMAQVLATNGDVGTMLGVVERLARVFKEDNPHFDAPKFFTACGFDYDVSSADDFKSGVGIVSYYPMVRDG